MTFTFQKVEGVLKSGWVYDIVRDRKTNRTVALCYHPQETDGLPFHPDCLRHSKDALVAEGLSLYLSDPFSTLAEAKRNAWENRESFSPDLD